MGLRLSHGCGEWSYHGFSMFRSALAHVAGLPPLWAMKGYFDPDEEIKTTLGNLRKMLPWLEKAPVAWEPYENDVLTKFLKHSDCDGSLDADACAPLADRIEALIPLLKKIDPRDFGGCDQHHASAKQLVSGLRRAADKNEPVVFG